MIGGCDPEPARREWLQSVQRGVKLTGDPQQLLELVRPDAVLIAAPPAKHAELAALAIRAGAHVLVEKPMGIDVAEATRLAAAASANERQLQVGYMRRFSEGYRKLYAHATVLNPGAVHGVNIVMCFNPDAWGTVSGHLETPARNTVLHDVASHQLDLIAWLLDARAIAVQAHRIGTHSICYELEMSNGIHVQGTAQHGGRYREHVMIETGRQLLYANPYGMFLARGGLKVLMPPLSAAAAYWHLGTSRLRGTPNATALSFARQLDDFAARIAGTPGDGADGASAVATHLGLQAIDESSERTGQRVPIVENV
jgi:predicted dehydrogenase